MERHFQCTACGQCCFGMLPLTVADAYRHAGRFPLALVWTPVPQGTRNFPLASHLGSVIRLPSRRQLAVVIAPSAYLPPSFACPELAGDGRCAIHEEKPLRCRTMPFYPWREEADQTDLLSPKKGWGCDVSDAAPVVYRQKTVVERDDFDRERQALLDQAPSLQSYAAYVLKYMPWIVDSLAAVAQKPGATVITSLSSFFTATREKDAPRLAALQWPLYQSYADRTAGIPELREFHRNYAGWAKEMAALA